MKEILMVIGIIGSYSMLFTRIAEVLKKSTITSGSKEFGAIIRDEAITGIVLLIVSLMVLFN